MTMFDVEKIRRDFPILDQKIRGKPLVYLDNAASSQKPNAVIDAISHNYRHDYANIHRGVHSLSERSTAAYENARGKVKRFINAASEKLLTRLGVWHDIIHQRLGENETLFNYRGDNPFYQALNKELHIKRRAVIQAVN